MAITFHPDGSITGAKMHQTGMVLQVVEAKITSPITLNVPTSWGDVSGLAVTISPTLSNSRILLTGMINHSYVDQHIGARVVRVIGGSQTIPTGWLGDGSGSRTQTLTGNWGFSTEANDGNEPLNINIIDTDHNTTSAITYKFQMYEYSSSSQEAHFNRSHNDTNAAYSYRGVSTLIATEIAA